MDGKKIILTVGLICMAIYGIYCDLLLYFIRIKKELKGMGKMNKKELINIIKIFDEKIAALNNEATKLKEDLTSTKTAVEMAEKQLCIYTDSVRIREWLIKTNFIGNLKSAEIIKQLKDEPLKEMQDFRNEYYSNPAFNTNCSKFVTLEEVNGVTYKQVCEEIKAYDFTNIDKFYQRIVDLEKLEKFLDEQRPITKKTIKKNSIIENIQLDGQIVFGENGDIKTSTKKNTSKKEIK